MVLSPHVHPLGPHAEDFIVDDAFETLLESPSPEPARVRAVVDKSLDLEPLTVEETAVLLKTRDPELVEEIFQTARTLKRTVYGDRIVLFAPLYVGNLCVNRCAYCGFRADNREVERRTLTLEEVREEAKAMVSRGHKRTIVVFGEHPRYSPEFIAECIGAVYEGKSGRGEMRRVNVNAAPFDVEGFRTIAEAEIGVYQVFQETYHHATFAAAHPAGTSKSDYLWRLDALSRAMEAGVGDVGIGALFGLHADWRFEVLGLVAHTNFLRARFGAGAHTISFPRLQPAAGVALDSSRFVPDPEFKRLIAVLRLAAPYTGLICTARERADVRREMLDVGVTQIDAGTRIDLGGYTAAEPEQVLRREQFMIGDARGLDEVVAELLDQGRIPSFCTACYRVGRTGPDFMKHSEPGAIHNLCGPNALSTLQEYLCDFASPGTREKGERRIAEELERMPEGPARERLAERLRRIREEDARDLFD